MADNAEGNAPQLDPDSNPDFNPDLELLNEVHTYCQDVGQTLDQYARLLASRTVLLEPLIESVAILLGAAGQLNLRLVNSDDMSQEMLDNLPRLYALSLMDRVLWLNNHILKLGETSDIAAATAVVQDMVENMVAEIEARGFIMREVTISEEKLNDV